MRRRFGDHEKTTAAEINAAFAAAAAHGLFGILRNTEAPVVSRDIVGDRRPRRGCC